MTDKVTMTALDTVHISNVSSENLVEGDVFIVSEADAQRMEEAGIAKRGGTAAKAVNARSAATRAETREDIEAERGHLRAKAIGVAPQNKMVKTPANKSRSVGKKKTA